MKAIRKPTPSEFVEQNKNRGEYYWRTSGIHTYNTLKREYDKVKVVEVDEKEIARKKAFEEWKKK